MANWLSAISMLPAMRSTVYCAAPLYGTWFSLTPALVAKSSVAKCPTVPTPGVP